MKAKFFKAISLLVAIVIASTMLIGCTSDSEGQGGTRTVTDMAGTVVEIPVEVNRVVSPYPIATNIIYTLQGQDKLVGIDDNSPDYEWLQKMDPNVTTITRVGMPWEVNIETILSLNPDVVIGASGDVRTQIENVGIPVIELDLGSGSDLETAIALIGSVLDEEDIAEELIDYYEDRMDLIIERTSEIAEADKVKVLSIGRDDIYTAAIGGCYQDRMIESAGGINVAHDLTGEGWFTQVSIEQIYTWDPEVILVPPYIWDGSAEAILADPQWQDIDAVKNGRVYTVPQGAATWDCPEPESFLCPIWIAQLLYPDEFTDIDIREEIEEFYSKFYGLSITESDIDQILCLSD